MEAVKTIKVKRMPLFSDSEDKIQEAQINLLAFKDIQVHQRDDKSGYRYLLPDLHVESYVVDSMDNGQNKAIMTMLSKSANMLELLLKAKESLLTNIQEQQNWSLNPEKEEILLDEINSLLKEIID